MSTAPSSPAAGAGPDQAALREAVAGALWQQDDPDSGLTYDQALAIGKEHPRGLAAKAVADVRARADAILDLPEVAAIIARAAERDVAVTERDEALKDKERAIVEVSRVCLADRETAEAHAAVPQAEADRLRAALRPFAEAAENLDASQRDSDHLWEGPEAMMLTAGDLRSARDAFAPQADPDVR